MEKPVVWILGAGGGVGGCVAEQLTAAGWKIVGSGGKPEKAYLSRSPDFAKS